MFSAQDTRFFVRKIRYFLLSQRFLRRKTYFKWKNRVSACRTEQPYAQYIQETTQSLKAGKLETTDFEEVVKELDLA